MDLDIELIREIKTQPVLYDPNDPMYKDTDFKHKIWLEIGKKILDNKDESTAGTVTRYNTNYIFRENI